MEKKTMKMSTDNNTTCRDQVTVFTKSSSICKQPLENRRQKIMK